MEKPTLAEFHLAMYAKYPGISFETCSELYYASYPDNKSREEPKDTEPELESKPAKKSKK